MLKKHGMPSWIWRFVYANYGGMSSLMLRVGCILVRSTSDWTCLVGHTHTHSRCSGSAEGCLGFILGAPPLIQSVLVSASTVILIEVDVSS